MGRDEDERSKLRALVEGGGKRPIKSHSVETDDSTASTEDIAVGKSAGFTGDLATSRR
jgi:hypothetical protein